MGELEPRMVQVCYLGSPPPISSDADTLWIVLTAARPRVPGMPGGSTPERRMGSVVRAPARLQILAEHKTGW